MKLRLRINKAKPLKPSCKSICAHCVETEEKVNGNCN